MVECPIERGVLIPRILQLDNAKGKAVDENHDVRPSVGFIFDHRELVDGQPVIGVGIIEIYKARLFAADDAILAEILDIHTLNNHPVQSPVLFDEGRGF